jgi:altronate dehydratase small subunit
MTIQLNAILIHESDNVVTALADIPAGKQVRYRMADETTVLAAMEKIPAFHKVAVREIRKKEPIRKYGEIIGHALVDIGKGQHVHSHNLIGPGSTSL